MLSERPYTVVRAGSARSPAPTANTANTAKRGRSYRNITLACGMQLNKDCNREKYGQCLRTSYSGLTHTRAKFGAGKSVSTSTTSADSNVSEKSQYKHRGEVGKTGDNLIGNAAEATVELERIDSTTWPVRVKCLMALCSAIICLYSANTEYIENYGPLQDLTTAVRGLNIVGGGNSSQVV